MTEVAFVDALKVLVEGVQSYFRSQNIDSVVQLGWKANFKQTNQGPGGANRVIIQPSKDDGSAGNTVQPRQVGAHVLDDTTEVHPIADIIHVVPVFVWARDADNPNSEASQVYACNALRMWTIRAVHSVLKGNGRWGAWKYTVPVERAFGQELAAELTFQVPIFDVPRERTSPSPIVNPPA